MTDSPTTYLSARIVWLIATAPGPISTPEIIDKIDSGDSSVRHCLKRLYERGLILRRTRHTDTPGTDPYEYALAPPPAWCPDCNMQVTDEDELDEHREEYHSEKVG